MGLGLGLGIAHLHDLGLERGTLAPHATHALLSSLEPATEALVRGRVRGRGRVRLRVRV